MYCCRSVILIASDITLTSFELNEAFVIVARNVVIDVSQAKIRWRAHAVLLVCSSEESRRIELKNLLGQTADAHYAITERSMRSLCGNQTMRICEIP